MQINEEVIGFCRKQTSASVKHGRISISPWDYKESCPNADIRSKAAEIEWVERQIHIDNNLLYSCDRGIYEDSPKTKQYIKLPQETMELLRE